jgi:aspartokinase
VSLIVQKFGGTSVGDVERIQRVAERVVATQRAGHQVAVIVSAMSDETAEEGDYLYEGADLGILITPGRLMTKNHRLNARARRWTKGVLDQYRSRKAARSQVTQAVAEVGSFKML